MNFNIKPTIRSKDHPGIGGTPFSVTLSEDWGKNNYGGDVLSPVYLPTKDYNYHFFSCRENNLDARGKVFRVKEGKHYSKGLIKRALNPKYYHCHIDGIKGEFSFLDVFWKTPRNVDDYDKNKLVGLGFGLNHHKNSIRIAFVPHFRRINQYHLYAYYYDEDEGLQKKYMCTVLNRIKYSYRINLVPNGYFINIDNTEFYFKNNNKDPKYGKVLVPYMGGDNPAIHDCNFYLTVRKF